MYTIRDNDDRTYCDQTNGTHMCKRPTGHAGNVHRTIDTTAHGNLWLVKWTGNGPVEHTRITA